LLKLMNAHYLLIKMIKNDMLKIAIVVGILHGMD
jgi:hypothetical protein